MLINILIGAAILFALISIAYQIGYEEGANQAIRTFVKEHHGKETVS